MKPPARHMGSGRQYYCNFCQESFQQFTAGNIFCDRCHAKRAKQRRAIAAIIECNRQKAVAS